MIFHDGALRDKHILITGASSGIGRATSIMMAAAGARLALCGRDEGRLRETQDALSGSDHVVSVSDFGQLDSAHDALVKISNEAGALNSVIHAAGVASLRIAKLYNDDHVQSVLGAALYGALGIGKACAKRKVMEDGGALIFMSSVAGSRGRAGMGAYAAAKASIGGTTRALAAEFAPRRIRVNEIVAGAIQTPMHDSIVKNLDETGEAAYRDLHLLGFGQADDIAATCTFLASDAASWITGASLAVDGGYMAT